MFQVYLSNKVKEQRELELPAPCGKIQEIYKCLKGEKPARRIEIAEIRTSILGLKEFLEGRRINRQGLLELDFLARRIQQMTETEREIFETAVGMEKNPSPLELINLSYNLNSYSFYPEIFTDQALGEHLIENGYDTLLDRNGKPAELIGEQYRQINHGIFSNYGYVEKNRKGIVPLYDGKVFPDLHASIPDTTNSLFELRFLRRGREYALHLPAKEEQIHCLKQVLGTDSLDTWPFYYARETVKGLKEHLPCQVTVQELNQFTASVPSRLFLEEKQVKLLFAALEAEMPQDIAQAIRVVNNIDSYKVNRTAQEGSIRTSVGFVKNDKQPIPALSEKICTVRFFSPLTSLCYGKYKLGGKIEYGDSPVIWDGSTLVDYQEIIRKELERECKKIGKQGLVECLSNVLLKRKVSCMIPGVEEWDHALWGVLEVNSYGELTDRELKEVRKEWEGQCADGFGEGFSQREIRIREGLLYIHFCASLWDFEIYTEKELKESGIHGMAFKMGGMYW